MTRLSSSSDVPLRGVNLGGWLVLERWLTPSLFAGTKAQDEYEFMKTAGAREKLARHRREFIVEADFAWLQKNGIDAVRIPVGYWLFEDQDGFMSSLDELEWAMRMAEKYDLKVLIDLHAVPGSQNGQMHSGRQGQVGWYDTASNFERTIEVLERIAKHFYDSPALWGIELVNEPKFDWRLRRFYKQAYERLIAVARPDIKLVFHDAFLPLVATHLLLLHKRRTAVLDAHWYHAGDTAAGRLPMAWYYWRLKMRRLLLVWLQLRQPVIIGEWSLVFDGRVWRRYDLARKPEFYKKHAAKQLALYGRAAGWFYWNYKADEQTAWNFRWLVESSRLKLTDATDDGKLT